jgi:hypothetical protein
MRERVNTVLASTAPSLGENNLIGIVTSVNSEPLRRSRPGLAGGNKRRSMQLVNRQSPAIPLSPDWRWDWPMPILGARSKVALTGTVLQSSVKRFLLNSKPICKN